MENIILTRTKQFTLDCFQFSGGIPKNYLSYHVRDQFVRSASSVSANYRATRRAQSRAAFVAKLSIVIEELDEVQHWLEILVESDIIEASQTSRKLWMEANELLSIFITTRKKMIKKK